MLDEPPGDAGGVGDGESALGPVGGGEAHEQGHVLGDHVADGVGDAQQQPGAVLQGAAVFVRALVAQRGEELVEEVPVGAVELHEVHAGLHGTAGRGGERGHDVVDALLVQRDGLGEAREGDGGGAHGLPAPVLRRDGPAGVLGAPGGLRAGLASRVGELHANGRALLVGEVHDPHEGVPLLVVPQSQVPVADAALGHDGARLHHHGPRPTGGERSVVHEVPVGGHAVLPERGVLAHGRDPQPVADREAAEGDGFEQGGAHGSPSVEGRHARAAPERCPDDVRPRGDRRGCPVFRGAQRIFPPRYFCWCCPAQRRDTTMRSPSRCTHRAPFWSVRATAAPTSCSAATVWGCGWP